MNQYEDVAIPFQMSGNRRFLSRVQLEELSYLMDFVERFKNCFEWDAVMQRAYLIEQDV